MKLQIFFPLTTHTVLSRVTSFVTFIILSNGNVKFCMYQQILLFRRFQCNVNLLDGSQQQQKDSELDSPERQWSFKTSIDNPLFRLTLNAYFSIWFPFSVCFLITCGFLVSTEICENSAVAFLKSLLSSSIFAHQKNSFSTQQNIM